MIRWHSTPESSDAGEPSVLAIVETLVVSAISYWIAWRWGTVQHIAIGACVAPLLLLRTEESQALAFRLVTGCGNSFERRLNDVERNWAIVARIPLFVVGLPLIILVTKVAATVTMAVCHPVAAFRAIPMNWKRVVLALDFRTAPEPLPGVNQLHETALKQIEFSVFLRFDKSREHMVESLREAWRTSEVRVVNTLLLSGLLGLLLLFIYLPALLYRWSLKASALIYAPLLYVVDASRKDEENPEGRLKYNGRSAFARLLAIYSLGVVALFCVKWYLLVHWNGFAAWWNGSPFWLTLGTLIEPRFFTKWQVAQAINAFLALGVFGFAWHLLQRSDAGFKVDSASANRTLSILFCVRAALTVYVLFCTIYLTVNGWQGFEGPPIGEGYVPSWHAGTSRDGR